LFYSCKPNLVPALETFVSVDCSLGTSHSAVVTNNGTLLTFGSNESGELGIGSTDLSSDKPRAIHIKDGNSPKFVKVACGDRFTYAICEDGKVFSWGLNWNGQLGRGDFLGVTIPDSPILSLACHAIKAITCGQSHSLFLTVSGFLYSCGSNNFGQLGHGDDVKRVRPTLIEMQRPVSFCEISSGCFHNLARDSEGNVYSWGSNSHGQLGHGNETSASSPTRIEFFVQQKLKVLELATGSRHSIATTESIGEDFKGLRAIYTWGCGASGQLGHGNTKSLCTPQAIKAEQGNIPTFISCGSEFTLVGFNNEGERGGSEISAFSAGEIENLGKTNLSLLYHKIQVVFMSASCLNASFLDVDPQSPNYHRLTNQFISGVHMPTVRQSFIHLVQLYEKNTSLMNVLANSTGKLVQNLGNLPFSHPSTLRVFLILVEVPWMLQVAQFNVVLEQLTRAIVGLSSTAKQILKNFWMKLSPEYAGRVLQVFKGYLEYLLSSSILDRTIISSVVLVMDILHQATHESKSVSHEKFAVPVLLQRINLQQDFENWRESAGRVFSFCDYPFLFDSTAKQKLLGIEASLQMREQVLRAILQRTSPCLELVVHRERVFDDVMNELVNYISGLDGFPICALKKPLVVKFRGEDGVDDGGLKRELFYLLTEKIFDKEHDLFQLTPETYFSWFSDIDHSQPHSAASITFPRETQYKLVGMVIGMAIYNHVLLNLHFPNALYRALMDKEMRLKDLVQFQPSVGKGLQQLMDMSDKDIEDCDLFFDIPTKNGKLHELCPNGSNIRVSKTNVALYVQLYCQYVLYDSVKLQLTALKEGFWLTSNGKAMKLLRAEELELFACGSPKLDFHALQRVTKYINGYTDKTPVINWFWEEVHGYSYEQKRNFMLFVTGAPRAPMQGLSHIPFAIQKSGPHSDRLPVAHTCYNILDLPEYASRKDLSEKLLIAINNSQGFGIV